MLWIIFLIKLFITKAGYEFLQMHGIEYSFALLLATITLFIVGGGKYSLDRFLEHKFLSEH